MMYARCWGCEPDLCRIRVGARRHAVPCGGVEAEQEYGEAGGIEIPEQGMQVLLGDERAGLGIVEHEADAVDRIGGIERDIGRTRLECGEQGDDHIEAAFEAQSDAIVGLDAESSEIVKAKRLALAFSSA